MQVCILPFERKVEYLLQCVRLVATVLVPILSFPRLVPHCIYRELDTILRAEMYYSYASAINSFISSRFFFASSFRDFFPNAMRSCAPVNPAYSACVARHVRYEETNIILKR